MKRISLAVVAVVFLAMSCSDDEPTPTRTQLLLAKEWRVTSSTVDGIEYIVPDCDKNNRFIFKESGELKVDYGTEPCDGEIPQPQTGTWQLLKNDTEIVWEFDNAPSRLKILELQPVLFRIEATVTTPKLTYTLKPIE